MTKTVKHTYDFSEYMKRVEPVFIFGINGAGTTLMNYVMHFHQQVVVLKGSYFFRHFWEIRKRVPIKALATILAETSCLYDQNGMLRNNQVAADTYIEKFIELIREDDPKKIFNYISYVTYRTHKDPLVSVKCWVERTNNHIFYYKKLKEWFPLCKFIICIRDPRAVITSQLMAMKRRGYYPSSDLQHCQNAAFDWLKRGKIIANIKKQYANDTYLNNYEDFVTDPIQSTNRLWRFLGVDEMSRQVLAKKIDELPEFYNSKTGVNRKGGIDTASVAKWKDLLALENQRIIEDIMGATAEKFGYGFEKKMSYPFRLFSKMPTENAKDYVIRLVQLGKKSVVQIH